MAELITSLPDLGRITAIMGVALAAMYGLCKAGAALLAIYSASMFGFGLALTSAVIVTGLAVCAVADAVID